jgi:hypothetical protein
MGLRALGVVAGVQIIGATIGRIVGGATIDLIVPGATDFIGPIAVGAGVGDAVLVTRARRRRAAPLRHRVLRPIQPNVF